jgi:Phage regulatory protein CII (CP76)
VVYSAIDVAIYQTVHGSGDPKHLSKQLGIPLSSLLNKANMAQEDRHFSLSEVLAVMLATKNFSILFALAAECGYTCIPTGPAGGEQNLLAQLAAITAEQGQLATVLLDAGADGEYSTNERRRIIKEALDAILALHKLISKVQEDDRESA